MKNKNRIIIISILAIIVIALISYNLIGTITMNNKIKKHLESKGCSNNDIKNIKIDHSYLSKILSYDEWSILVEFKKEPNVLYGFTYKNKEIIFRGVSNNQNSKDELKQLEEKFNDGKLCSLNELALGEESKYKVSDNLVSIQVNDETLTNKKATFTYTNHTSETYDYGEPFAIEYQKDGIWYKIKPIHDDYGFTLPAYILKSKESKTKEYVWDYIYGELKEGKYRLITSVFAESDIPITEDDHVYIAAEFIIK